jgi:carbon monoxide dehydrogenase subunit G
MAPIEVSIDVARPQDEAFAYVTDPSRFAEWQAGVVGGHMDGDATSVGSKCMTTRRIGGAEREVTSQVTKSDPPRAWGVRGIDGQIRAIVNVTVESLNASPRSRVTIALDFEGRGIGKLLVPLVVHRQARREMPAHIQRLKERLAAPAH